MGGLLQQVRLWLPIVRSHRRSSLQQRDSYEPLARQEVRTTAPFTTPFHWKSRVIACSVGSKFKHAAICRAALKSCMFYFQSRIPAYLKMSRSSIYVWFMLLLHSMCSGPSITMQSWVSGLSFQPPRFPNTLLVRWLCSSTSPTTWRRTWWM